MSEQPSANTAAAVTMIGLVHPKIGIPAQEFHDRWRRPHVDMVRGIQRIQHYVQHHRIHDDLIPADESPYLGVADLRFASLADAQGLGTDPQYLDRVEPDERSFVEQSRGLGMLAAEEAVLGRADLDPDVYITLWQFVRDRTVDWTGQESLTHAEQLGASRHLIERSHVPDSELAIARQFSWPTLEAFQAAQIASPAAFAALREVPGSFLLLTRSERAF